jgi:hypothetical protein
MEPLTTKRLRSDTVTNFLSGIYANPFTHSNSIEGLYQNAISNNTHRLNFNREDVRKFLSNQKSFNAFQPIDQTQRQQKTPLVIGRYEKWQMDLIDMRKYSEHNDDIN